MTDSEYVPGEREVRADFVLANTRNFDSYQVGRPLASEQERYGDEFDRWIDQVKAEAAREALTEYASEFEGEGSERIGPKRAACGCDLTGMAPPAVHIVDRHEEK